jgi:hypothetical protein
MWFLHILLAIASCTVEVIARPINQTAALEPNQPPILHAPFSEIDVAQGESSLLLASAILDDPDVRNDMFGALRVAMTAEHGQLVGPAPHSPALGGVRFLTLADAATMTEETAGRHLEWTGPPEGCAVALQRVKYVAPSDFVGTDAIHVSVSDLGFTGVGGEKTTNFSVAVTVTYKPLPPTLSAVAENLLVNESSASGSLGQYFMLGPVPNSNTLNASAASVNELLSPRYQLDLAAALGTLAPMAAADTISNSTASAAGSWSALGTLAELQAALSALSYHPPVGWHSARLPIRTERLGATLALVIEPSLSAMAKVTGEEGDTASAELVLGPAATTTLKVHVAPVNDPPVWHMRSLEDTGLRTAEDTPLRLAGAVAVVDPDIGEAGGAGDGLIAVSGIIYLKALAYVHVIHCLHSISVVFRLRILAISATFQSRHT